MPADSVPVDAPSGRRIFQQVLDHLPTGWKVMPIGGLAMMQVADQPGQLTRDVDAVPLVLVDGILRVPPAAAVLEMGLNLSLDASLRKDQTSVQLVVRGEEGPVKVELIRGRNARSGGYFVSRPFLEKAASLCASASRVLYATPEVLACLKAWAAVDEDKLVEAGKDARGFHRARAAAFRQDVSRIRLELAARARAPDAAPVSAMLGVCPPRRAARIRTILETAGWPVAA